MMMFLILFIAAFFFSSSSFDWVVLQTFRPRKKLNFLRGLKVFFHISVNFFSVFFIGITFFLNLIKEWKQKASRKKCVLSSLSIQTILCKRFGASEWKVLILFHHLLEKIALKWNQKWKWAIKNNMDNCTQCASPLNKAHSSHLWLGRLCYAFLFFNSTKYIRVVGLLKQKSNQFSEHRCNISWLFAVPIHSGYEWSRKKNHLSSLDECQTIPLLFSRKQHLYHIPTHLHNFSNKTKQNKTKKTVIQIDSTKWWLWLC